MQPQSTGIIRSILNALLIAAITVGGLHLWPVGEGAGRPRPKPPTPTPVPPPVPPAPIPAPGLHVLIVFESADVANYPRDQWNAIYGQEFHDYLNAHCPLGPDGKTHTWRIFDKDTAVNGDDPVWKAALSRPRSSLPWIVVSNPGKGGFEGPLPKSKTELLALVQKYGG